MGRNRFVESEPERIPLSDGDWIEVKKDLNNGEQKALEQAGVMPPIKDANGNIITPIDWAESELQRAMIFLLDWSFKDKSDKPVKLTMGALRAIDPQSFTEINNAILAHVAKRAVERGNEARARAEALAAQGEPAATVKMVEAPTPTPAPSATISG